MTWVPLAVASPAVRSKSFTATGTPCKSPKGAPLRRLRSWASADLSASSAVTMANARNSPSNASMRASSASVT